MARELYSLTNSGNPMYLSSRFLNWEASVAAAMVAPRYSLSTDEAGAGRLGVQANLNYTVRLVSNQSLMPKAVP